MKPKTAVEPQRKRVHRRRPDDIGPVCACPVSNVVGVGPVTLVILGEALLVPVNPARIEQEQVQVVGLEFGIGGQLQEEG